MVPSQGNPPAVVKILWHGSAKRFLIMLSKYSHLTSCHSCSMSADWIWCRNNTFLKVLRLKHAARKGRELVDFLSHIMPILNTGSSYFVLTTTRLSYSSSCMASWVASLDIGKQIISTHEAEVLCTQSWDISRLAPCTHLDVDTCILLQLEDAVKEGYT